MNWLWIGTTLICAALHTAPASADVLKQNDYVQFANALTDTIVIPAYERFAIETAVLNETLVGFCANPTPEGAKASFDRFHDTMDAWARVQPLLFGPIMNAPGPARIQFWPDKRGTGQRHLRRVLGSQDASVLRAESLATKSIALGDLQALEYVMFDNPEALLSPASFRCAYASAIANLQRSRAATLLQDWTKPDGYRTQVINAAEGTDAFFDEREAASAYLNSIISALEIIRLQKLDRPLGLTLDSARSARAESWRSARSFRNIQLNFETITALLSAPSGLNDLTRKAQKPDTAAALAQLTDKIRENLSRFEQPLSALVSDANARPKLEALLTSFRDLQSLIQDRVARDVGLVPGFNATDGD